MKREENGLIEEKIKARLLYHEEKTYIEVPFFVEEDIEKIEIEIDFDSNDGKNVIDLGLMDEETVRGWSGGARRKIFITEYSSTYGYISGTINKGIWKIILGTYKLDVVGCEVNISVRRYKNHYRWIKGDFHTHTYHSDGKYTLEEVANIAIERGLDFIALTDHNTTSQNYSYHKNEPVLFIPGMELTTNFGHCNLLGVKSPVKDFRCLNMDDIKETIKEARNNNCKIVINHPHDKNCGWEFGFDVDYNCIEIWNGNPQSENNQETLKWWQKNLKGNKKINVIGGSDIHKGDNYLKHGTPTTWVWSNEKSIEAILAAICSGHAFLTKDNNGPTIDMRYGDSIMGDTVEFYTGSLLYIEINELLEGDIVKIISEKDSIEEYHIKNSKVLITELDIKNEEFIRVEVWRRINDSNKHSIVALSNPIYNKRNFNNDK